RGVVDALRDLLDLAGSPGALPLPWDMSATVDSTAGGGVVVALGWVTPVAGPSIALSGGITLVVSAGFDVRASLATTVEVSGTGLDHARLDLAVDGDVSLAVAIQPSGGDETILRLLPALSGFES